MQCRVNLFCCCFAFDNINYGKAKIGLNRQVVKQFYSFLAQVRVKKRSIWLVNSLRFSISYVDLIVTFSRKNWINLLSSDQQDLVCLSTGKLASSDVGRDLLCATQVKEDAYKLFSKQGSRVHLQNVSFTIRSSSRN